MSFFAVIGIAVGLAMDATAVAIATSIMLGRVNRRQVFRFAFHFGLFQALMPVIGWVAGRSLREYIENWDHWVAFGLLTLIGGKAIIDVIRPNDEEAKVVDPTRGLSLIVLSVATSIDALAVGLSLALLQVTILYPAAVIGVITAGLTVCGMLLGSRVGQHFGLRVRVLGGVILIGIGLKILVEHTLVQ
jgi:manganese efflux pump family protein